MELTAGTKLGIFTIVKQIGAGGMSEVYLVKDNLGRPFALKTMSRRLSFDPSFRQRFEQEAKIMATLNHPNIVQMHSYFEAEGRFCLAMEYVEGGSLKDLTRKIGPIPEKRALNILKQIAKALSYAHGKGIIHRDIKPSNILLDSDDNVKVMDFGIARMAEGPGLTMTGTQMGTLVYMSPEQIKDSKHVDHKTDIYSLGVSFYEMLTGRPPYDESDSNDFEIRVNIVQNDLPNPRKIYPHIGDDVVLLLDGLTKKRLDERLDLSKLLTIEIPEKPIQKEKPTPQVEVTEHIEIPKNRKERKRLSPVIVAIILTCIVMLIAWASKENLKFSKNSPTQEQALSKPEMVFVEGGTFMMGSNDGTGYEKPIHEVTLPSFWIGKYQVTQKEWVDVMGNNPSHWKSDLLPVENVSWFEAVEYCNKRSIREGLAPCYSGSGNDIVCNWNSNGYRLPTEAEWEFAARGGVKNWGYKYSGSNDVNAVAWYDGNSRGQTHEVGAKSPNELSIYDMSGNIWEWCWDIYGAYPSSHQTNPRGADSGSSRVFRGGSWSSYAGYCTVSYQSFNLATDSSNNLGFRVCRISP